MRRYERMAGILATMALLPAAYAQQPDEKGMLLDGVAAYVNDRMITISDVMSEVRGSAWVELSRAEREARLHEVYTTTLNAMIDRRLILDAARAANAKIAPWAVENSIHEILDRRFGGDRAGLIAALKEQRMTYEEWRQSVEDDLTIRLMRHTHVDRNILVSPREVRAYYANHRESFIEPGGTHVALIVFAAPRDASATLEEQGARILRELADGVSFADAARLYSQDARAARGGDWGMVNPSEVFLPEIAEAVAKLEVGAHSAAIPIGDFGYIVRKIAEREPRQLTLEEAWPWVENRLYLRQSEQRHKAWVKRLRDRAYVKVLELPRPE